MVGVALELLGAMVLLLSDGPPTIAMVIADR